MARRGIAVSILFHSHHLHMENTTPTNKPGELPTAKSTPASKGTASNAEFATEGRFVFNWTSVAGSEITWIAPSVIQLLEEDLRDAPYTQLKEMLTAFLKKMRMGQDTFDASKEFDAFLDESVKFCNSDASKHVKASICQAYVFQHLLLCLRSLTLFFAFQDEKLN